MAATALRLRRTLTLSSTILHHSKPLLPSTPTPPPPPSSSSTPIFTKHNPTRFNLNQPKPTSSTPCSYKFIRSRPISSRSRYNDDVDGDQISPDAILFEGCDYNHWLITIDFPKDPKPSPEEMVEFYVQTAAKVLGSVEEAKKKIYACSTTTYHGFQVEVSEEVSEQFKSIPEVVFVLPDSYIDPVNKEYGGDKYMNGTIIPRPPPVQYGRQNGRYNDRNREYNRPPRGQFDQNNASGGQGNYQRGPMPPNQGNYNQGEGRSIPPRDQGNNQQSGARDFRGPGSNFTPSPGGGYNQGGGGGFRQGTGGQYGQGGGGGGGYGQGTGGQYGQGGGGGGYGQGAAGQYVQTPGGGNYGQGTSGLYGQGGGGGAGSYGQGTSGQYGHGGGGGGSYSQGSGAQGGGGGYGQGTSGNYAQGGGGGNFGQGGGGHPGQVSGGNCANDQSGQYRQGMGYGGNQPSSQYGGNPSFSQAGPRDNTRDQQGNYEAVEEVEAFKER